MQKLKSHKTVEQIAKKHKVEVSFIKNQLKIGEPIEHEHTQDHELATSIALQHLEEIPDYYTKLKKMESKSKKELKEASEKRYCPLCEKTETRSECSYGGKVWDKVTKAKNESLDHRIDHQRHKEILNKRTKLEKIQALSKAPGTKGEGDAAKDMEKRLKGPDIPNFVKKSKIVENILNELIEEKPCWKGYTAIGMKKKGKKKVPNCVPKKNIQETTRIQTETGNIMSVTLSWRGKYYTIQMFFPQAKIPSRKDIAFEIQKIYPESRVIHSSVAQMKPGEPLVRVSGGSYSHPGPSKNYVKPMGEGLELVESERIDKSKMKCNKPKAQAVGDSLTGKSHVVKACDKGTERIIRFGQRGVKGSPKKKGESKAYANRRKRFKARHGKNIAKGKMSAAFWADKVKW